MFCCTRRIWHHTPPACQGLQPLTEPFPGRAGQGWGSPYNLAMNDPVHEFGSARSIDAEAIGQPGQRRFRLLVLSSYGAAAIWMEKEQLSGIGDWLTETVGRLDADRPTNDPDTDPMPFPAEVDVEVRAGQLALGYVEDRDLFAIQVYDLETGQARTTRSPRSAASSAGASRACCRARSPTSSPAAARPAHVRRAHGPGRPRLPPQQRPPACALTPC